MDKSLLPCPLGVPAPAAALDVPTILARPTLSIVEDEQAWALHRAGVVRSLGVEQGLELALGERIALLLWRLARVARSEAELISIQQEKVEDDLAGRRKHDSYRPANAPCHPADVRGDVPYHERRVRLLKRYPKLRDPASISASDASELVWSVARAAAVDLEECDLPGIPEDAILEELPDWTVGKVRACIEVIAAQNPDDPQELLQISLDYEDRQLRLARSELERTNRDLDRMRRERLLPDLSTLEKHSRYEAHLSRELASAMRELQAFKQHRLPADPSVGACFFDMELVGNRSEKRLLP